jgi:putative hemolysin
LRIPEKRAESMTEEEVKFAIAEGTEAGVIDEVEEEMTHGVLKLADRSVASVMVPRPDVYWVDLDDEPDILAREIAECPYSRIVVARAGDIGRPVGVVQKKNLVGDLIADQGIRLERHLIQPVFVPETLPVLRLLELFRTVPVHIAFVIDEYGDFLGIATLTDVMEGIAGELPEEHEGVAPAIVRRPDGSFLVEGSAPIEEVASQFDLELDGTEYHTAAGLALDKLARIPDEGDRFTVGDWRVEVVDMDGKRIDKLLFTPQPQEAASS